MSQHLLLTVHLYGDGQGTARYHGMNPDGAEWPPAPARVFQALVAGVARGRALPISAVRAFQWLETLSPPTIAAPTRTLGQSLALFVPNNDADALADPRNVAEIRTKKLVQPSLFAEDAPLLYAWEFVERASEAQAVIDAAKELYQLGRGVDPAWAQAEVIDAAELAARLSEHPGVVHRPNPGATSKGLLACPAEGSMASLVQRHDATRLRTEAAGKTARVLFTNQPKPRFASVSYVHANARAVFELRDLAQDKPWPWSQTQPTKLVERCRDAAAARLREALGAEHQGAIEQALVGRKVDGRDDGPIANRIRIVALPSIGSSHADRAIRRILVEVPSGGPIRAADVMWAFSGLEPLGTTPSPWALVRSDDETMLGHYLGPSRRWRSVSPLALPEGAKRRRIEPARQRQEANGAVERIEEEKRAAAAVRTALRHADVRAKVVGVRVQREAFEAPGARAEMFADGTRFAKERLWHVELELDRPLQGPLVLGDGRFLGLGLMAPVRAELGLFAFSVVDGLVSGASAESVARALRRAVMARVQGIIGEREELPPFFSGHGKNSTAIRGQDSAHLAFGFDSASRRLLVVAPHLVERRSPTTRERAHLRLLEASLEGLRELRAGAAGLLALLPTSISQDRDDPLVGPSRIWESATPYVVTRHVKGVGATEALAADVRAQCRRFGLPEPKVEARKAVGTPGTGLTGELRMTFGRVISGPLLLGRTRHLGGGLFRAVDESSGAK